MEKRRIIARILSSLLSMILITCFEAKPVFGDQADDVRESSVSGASATVETSEAWEETNEDDCQPDYSEIIIEQDPGKTGSYGGCGSTKETEGTGTPGSTEEIEQAKGTGTSGFSEGTEKKEGTGTSEYTEETETTEGTVSSAVEGEREEAETSGSDGEKNETGTSVAAEEERESATSGFTEKPDAGEFIKEVENSDAEGKTDTGSSGINDADVTANENRPDDQDGSEEPTDAPDLEFSSVESEPVEEEFSVPEYDDAEEGNGVPERFVIENGLLTAYSGNEEEVIIPAGVTGIGNSAFIQCTSLKSVTIPESVISIGDNAFMECLSLESVTFQGVILTFGIEAFKDCTSLKIYCRSDAACIIDYAKQYSIPYGFIIRESVREIIIDNSSVVVFTGKTKTLTAAVNPDYADLKDVTWESSNTNIATVTPEGVVRGVARGTVTVTTTAQDGSNVKATCKVTVKQPVKKLTMSRKTATVKNGGKVTLKVTAAPENANNKAVKWTTSNAKIAKVSSKGVVRGVARGTATITAAAKDGSGVKATCKVTVKQSVTKLTMSRKAVTIKNGRKVTLKATAAPKNANNKVVKWTTSNAKIAKVTSKGVVRGVARGTATITATAKDGSGVKATCKVTVIKQTYPEKDTINVNGTSLLIGQYANFRNVSAGTMAPNVLYRCINPIIPYSSKQKMPAYYADMLLEAHDVNTVINLSDTLGEMKSKGYSKAAYYKKLLKKGKVYSRKLQDNGKYDSVDKKRAVADAVRVIVQHEGPYAVHCRWGQGRTGIVIMLLESLMGADYEYIYNDFVTTFMNFRLVGKYTSSNDYNKEFSKYMRSMTGKKASNPKKPKERDWRGVDLAAAARKYLQDGGMTDAEIKILIDRLSSF